MRPLLVLLHRWVGLMLAGFLFVTGLTGAVISWDHELDHWLNPHLSQALSSGPALPVLDMVRQIEQRYPEVRVTYFEMAAEEPGESQWFWVEPRLNPATGKLYEPGFNQVFVDPVTGAELGKREWGAVWPITTETLISFLYKLHFSLHIPEMAGIDRWGVWLLGAVAILWTLDCFTGLALTLPKRMRNKLAAAGRVEEMGGRHSWWPRWWQAWKIRWRAGTYKLNYDLHRAVSLWTWGLLFIIAFTAFSLNLYREVFFPMMTAVSDVTPTPFDQRKPNHHDNPIEPGIAYSEALARAQVHAHERGWQDTPGSLFYSPEFGIYRVEFFPRGDAHGAYGVEPPAIFLDGADGRLIGDAMPWRGTAADIFVQIQFPLHSGRILGLPGRILVSVMGILIAMLSVTGVYIWWRKRSGRAKAATVTLEATIPAHETELQENKA